MADDEPETIAAELDFDLSRILESLTDGRVRFVLVGGSAAWLYGANRPTSDADLVVDYGEENLARLALVLNDLNWRYRIDGLTDTEAAEVTAGLPMHPDTLRRGLLHTLMTDAGPVDILRSIPSLEGEDPGRDFELLNSSARTAELFLGLSVKLASLDHIIESKQWANRPKDRQAIPELIELNRRANTDAPTRGSAGP